MIEFLNQGLLFHSPKRRGKSHILEHTRRGAHKYTAASSSRRQEGYLRYRINKRRTPLTKG